MRKQLLTGALLLTALFSADAQVVWTDNFNDQDISDWTLTDSDGDELNWGDIFQIGDNQGGFITPVSLISRSWQGGVALTPDNWAVSPVINLSAYPGQDITLTWIQQTNAEFPEDKYSVYVGTTNDIADLLSSEVSFTITVEDGAPTNQSLDLSSFAGETAVYVAFRHYDSSDFDYVSIDDVTVTAGDIAGLNENLASKFSVSPNPANTTININSSNNALINGAEIVDMNGRTVKTATYNGVSDAQINISDLSSGVYMINLASDQGKTTKKIIKN